MNIFRINTQLNSQIVKSQKNVSFSHLRRPTPFLKLSLQGPLRIFGRD